MSRATSKLVDELLVSRAEPSRVTSFNTGLGLGFATSEIREFLEFRAVRAVFKDCRGTPKTDGKSTIWIREKA